MLNKQNVLNQIEAQKILPLFYHDDLETCKAIVDALYSAGITIVEFTNRGSKALDNFSALVVMRAERWPNLLLAVGTIQSAADARLFITAGADVLISPTIDNAVAAAVGDKLWIPGCMTPTEIQQAQQLGCNIIKLFPGSVLQTSFIPAIKPLFPNSKFLVTGGVVATAESILTWLGSGAIAVGLGSGLITKDIIENKQFNELSKTTLGLLQSIKN